MALKKIFKWTALLGAGATGAAFAARKLMQSDSSGDNWQSSYSPAPPPEQPAAPADPGAAAAEAGVPPAESAPPPPAPEKPAAGPDDPEPPEDPLAP